MCLGTRWIIVHFECCVFQLISSGGIIDITKTLYIFNRGGRENAFRLDMGDNTDFLFAPLIPSLVSLYQYSYFEKSSLRQSEFEDTDIKNYMWKMIWNCSLFQSCVKKKKKAHSILIFKWNARIEITGNFIHTSLCLIPGMCLYACSPLYLRRQRYVNTKALSKMAQN